MGIIERVGGKPSLLTEGHEQVSELTQRYVSVLALGNGKRSKIKTTLDECSKARNPETRLDKLKLCQHQCSSFGRDCE